MGAQTVEIIQDAKTLQTPNAGTPDVQQRSVVTHMDMLSHALASGASMEQIDKLISWGERLEAAEARRAFDAAMSAAKAEIPVIRKNRQVEFVSKKDASRTDYRHEDLAEIARTIDPILGKHGLSYRFRTKSNLNEPISVTCIVSHRLGYSEENTLTAGRDDTGNKNSIQQVGSTLTYLQRYTLKAALGLAASYDDDGKAAGDADGAISEEQIAQLAELGEGVKIDPAAFCKFFGIAQMADLPARRFSEAVAMIEAKRRKSAQVPS